MIRSVPKYLQPMPTPLFLHRNINYAETLNENIYHNHPYLLSIAEADLMRQPEISR